MPQRQKLKTELLSFHWDDSNGNRMSTLSIDTAEHHAYIQSSIPAHSPSWADCILRGHYGHALLHSTHAHVQRKCSELTAEKNIQIHTRRATHTHTVVQSAEQACWVAVSTYSAAMATSFTAIDSTAKWVRVFECDNLVKITLQPDTLHPNVILGFSAGKRCIFFRPDSNYQLSAPFNSSERRGL